jgi:phospholipid N-methyltransferase
MSPASNRASPDRERISHSDFLRSFFRDYRTVGAIRETSAGVARRIAELAGVSNARYIAELGCGTGPITKIILQQMPEDAILWGYEIHEPFAEHLKRVFIDPRFTLHTTTANELPQHRKAANLPPFDAVISTIPFSYLTRHQSTDLLRAVIDTMSDDGRFVALQYHPTYLPPMLRREFDQVDRELYFWNLPPATLLTATKPRRL